MYHFDELAKSLATPLPRRQALRSLGGAALGVLAGACGFVGRAAAETHNNCNLYCRRFFTAAERVRCLQVCVACPSVNRLCGTSGLNLVCCPSAPNASVGCVNNTCAILSCSAGYANCNYLYADGCETNYTSDPNNCGSCARRCTTTTSGYATCTNGVCGIACYSGYTNCYGTCINLSSDPNNCGSCGRVCGSANGTATCNNGTCGIICNNGYANCDNNTSNGCETNLMNDSRNCGACGRACATGQSCVTGMCR